MMGSLVNHVPKRGLLVRQCRREERRSRVERREKKGTRESRTRKILLLKMSQSIVARWSHPRRADRSRIQRSLSPFREAKRVPCSLFVLSLSLFLFPFLLPLSRYLRFSFSLGFTPSSSVPRIVVNGQRDWTRRKGIHFVPFWRRWDANTTVSFSVVLSLPAPLRPPFLYLHDFESQQQITNACGPTAASFKPRAPRIASSLRIVERCLEIFWPPFYLQKFEIYRLTV